MLDVIVTVSDTTPIGWVDQCLRSCEVAIEHAGYPVQLLQVPGVPGHIGRAMANGLARSNAEYVAWVDDDDWVLPNAFSCLRRHMDSPVDAICAREVHVLANGRHIPKDYRHHLTAFRRSAIAGVDLSLFPSMPNAALHKATPNAAHERSWVYMYRIRRSPAMALRAAASEFERGYV